MTVELKYFMAGLMLFFSLSGLFRIKGDARHGKRAAALLSYAAMLFVTAHYAVVAPIRAQFPALSLPHLASVLADGWLLESMAFVCLAAIIYWRRSQVQASVVTGAMALFILAVGSFAWMVDSTIAALAATAQ